MKKPTLISDELFGVRGGKDSDTNFIFVSWLKSYKDESLFARRIRSVIFFDCHHQIIESILSKPQTKVLIAHLKEDPEVILGYLVFEEGKVPIVHYVFVKKEWRRAGLGSHLLSQAIPTDPLVYFTHWTYSINEFIDRLPRLTYHPYRL